MWRLWDLEMIGLGSFELHLHWKIARLDFFHCTACAWWVGHLCLHCHSWRLNACNTQEVKPQTAMGPAHWGFVDTSVCLELKQAKLGWSWPPLSYPSWVACPAMARDLCPPSIPVRGEGQWPDDAKLAIDWTTASSTDFQNWPEIPTLANLALSLCWRHFSTTYNFYSAPGCLLSHAYYVQWGRCGLYRHFMTKIIP